jgi:hypothetical protein
LNLASLPASEIARFGLQLVLIFSSLPSSASVRHESVSPFLVVAQVVAKDQDDFRGMWNSVTLAAE